MRVSEFSPLLEADDPIMMIRPFQFEMACRLFPRYSSAPLSGIPVWLLCALVFVLQTGLTREARGEESPWEIVKYQGRDYLTADSIHRFYRFQSWSEESGHVWFKSPTVVLKGRIGSQDILINDVRFIMSYPMAKSGSKVLISRLDLVKLIDPVFRPSHIKHPVAFDTVVIDPGHGGHDGGAGGVAGKEKDFALDLGRRLKVELESKGLKVRMTRSTDTFLTLGERVRVANRVPNSIFISLHFNAGPRTANGIETFALSPQGSSSTMVGSRRSDNVSFQGNRRDAENIALATSVHASVLRDIPSVDRGIKRARWAVLTGIDRPAILFEGGFVTSPTEGREIGKTEHRAKLAAAIAKAVVTYRNAVAPKTPAP